MDHSDDEDDTLGLDILKARVQFETSTEAHERLIKF